MRRNNNDIGTFALRLPDCVARLNAEFFRPFALCKDYAVTLLLTAADGNGLASKFGI